MIRTPQLPSPRQRRRWATRIIVLWAQVFVVLPAVHLHAHGHHHDHGYAEHFGQSPPAHDHAEAPGAAEDHADHDARSAAHLNAAILPTTPTLFTLFHRIPAERPLRAAPAPLDLAHAGHGWTPRGPPA